MAVTVKYNNFLLYSNTIESLKVTVPKLTQEVNKTGSFTFTIYPDHPYYSRIEEFAGIVTIYDDDILLFRGRIIKIEQGFRNERKITCEGELGFLLDSIQRPYEFTGTPEELFRLYITEHNSQVDAARRFVVGNVTVTDANDYIVRANSDYTKTWDELNDKLVKNLGGYLWVRHENGINYIDYLKDFTILSNQQITFGKNLINLIQKISADSFATALIPLGAKDELTGNRLTIKAVNNDVDYVYNKEAYEKYGFILTTNTWDDVTDPSNLKRKGQEYIDNLAQFTKSVDVTAADLKGTGVDVNSFRYGRYVKAVSLPHNLANNFLITKITRELDKPQNTKLTLGTSYKTMTDLQASSQYKENQLVNRVDNVEKKVNSISAESRSILKIEEFYLVSSKDSGITIETEGWSTAIPTMTETDRYLWNYTKITFTDNSTTITTPLIIGMYGKEGKDGKDAAIQSDTEPSDKSYLWLDTSATPATLKSWNGEDWEVVNDQSEAIILLEERLESNISQTAESIRTEVSEKHYLKEETDTLIQSVNTQIEQTSEYVEIQFNQFLEDLKQVSDDKDTQFSEIQKYIRFVDGNIVLGEKDNKLILRIENDRISFLQDNTEVAYFSNNRLYVTDGEFLHSLKIGHFEYLPRANGNLSFMKTT